jgi:ribosomal protein S27AE
MVWQSFRSVRKTTTALGQVRFDAGREYDHADLFWAKCLAEAAVASGPAEHPLIALWREQAEAIKARETGTDSPSDLYRTLAEARLRDARSGIFGAEKWLLSGAVQPPRPACEKCGNKNLAIYLETMRCGVCGWMGPRTPR